MPVPAQARHFSETRGQKSVTFSLDNIAYPRGFKVGRFSVFEQREGGGLYFSIAVWLWAGAFFSVPLTVMEKVVEEGTMCFRHSGQLEIQPWRTQQSTKPSVG